jgi:hypothetical protein
MAEIPSNDAAACVLTEEGIQHISDAFDYLYHGLKEAMRRFENPDAQDAGRDGAIHALEYVLKFFTVIERTGVYPFIAAEGVHAPLARLHSDLMSLDDGMVSAMLMRKKKSGRARASSFYDGLKGIVVFTVRRLRATGVSLPEARRMVASVLAKQGIQPAREGSRGGTGELTDRTLRKWQDDIGINETATDALRQAEAAHLKEVLEGFGLSALPTGSTVDELLLQHFKPARLQLAYLDRLRVHIAKTRGQETT